MPTFPARNSELADRFSRTGYVAFPGFLAQPELSRLTAELRRLEEIAKRRDFAMACMDDSPRHMTTLGGHVIAAESALVPELYADGELIARLRTISRLDVTPVPDPVERHVLNILHREGDTHGAHIDDYPLALVVFTESPESPEDGGQLEYAPHTGALRSLKGPLTRRAHHRPGDAYLLRSDTIAHRVTPLQRPGLRRVALNLAYTTPERRTAATTSAAQLYE
jgi:hypothetical protein